MSENDWLAEQFEANRTHLRAVAYQMLGSTTEADDAVQEAWIRLSRTDTSAVENLGGWLTTVTSRVCLDMLRSRRSRREDPIDAGSAEPPASRELGIDPEHEALMADAVGPAMLVVLDTLAPAERIAFVLHDVFGVSFDEIAPVVGRTPTAARQLASRARRRVQGAPAAADVTVTRQREVVDAFLAAARGGDFDALLAVLDPDVVFRNDPSVLPEGAEMEVRGAPAVAELFNGRAKVTRAALLDGAVGISIGPRDHPAMVMRVTFAADTISGLEVVADLDGIDHEVLND